MILASCKGINCSVTYELSPCLIRFLIVNSNRYTVEEYGEGQCQKNIFQFNQMNLYKQNRKLQE